MISNEDSSIAAMQGICRKTGAEGVSESADKEMAKVLEEIGMKIAEEALDFTVHTGKKLLKEET